jgi:glycerophosphoryl diester phosphodiesterase
MTPTNKLVLCLAFAPMTLNAQANPFFDLMQKAAAHAKAHHSLTPALSPVDATILNGQVPVAELQKAGIKVVPWTTNDPEKMRAVIRTGVDGLISDRPDLLQKVVAEERAAKPGSLKGFDVQGHRGGRGIRPENTLPAFEAGLDNLIHTIETDTGVTKDHVSIIWHDQFLNPQSCRKADGSQYTLESRVYHNDITIAEAQSTFICDKLHTAQFPDQKNDLALSPVAVAFAAKEKLISPYVPTYVEQLFRFVAFYEDFYKHGEGKSAPDAAARAANAARVHFNMETKILPEDLPPPPANSPAAKYAEMLKNHTFGPQAFVDALCGAIAKHHMEARSDVQSFDFRTLVLVEEQYPKVLTFYLTEAQDSLYGPMLPASLRATK